MLSLTEFETSFQTFQFRIGLKISDRLKTRFIGEFCLLLTQRENPVLNQSYYEEILPPLQQHLSNESLSYQPIELILPIYQTLNYVKGSGLFDEKSAGFEVCVETVKQQLFSSYIYLSEFEKAIQIACEDQETNPNLQRFTQITSFEQFCIEVKQQKLPESLIENCDQTLEAFNAETMGYSGDSVWIPLVEKFEEPFGEEHIVGTIYPLGIDLEPRQTNRDADVITFNNHPLDHDDLVMYQAQDAIKAARDQHASLRSQSSTRYSVSFGFPSLSYSIAGSSFGFGMAMLVLCSLERDANLRAQHSVSKSIAITGGIDLTGNIRNVSGFGLREKIRAVFYSPLTSMLIPFENMLASQEIVNELRELHPFKKFTLIPEKSLATVLDNQKVLHHKNIALMEWVKIHLTKFKIFQIIMIILFAVALTIGMTKLAFDDNPSDYKIEGESVLLFNNTDQFLWSVEMGHTPEYLESDSPQKPIYRRLQIHDYDGDGKNEVILGTAIKQHEFNGHLTFLESDGSVKWTFSDHPVVSYGGVEYTNNYGVGFIYPFRHENAMTHDFYVRFSHMPWFPNRLVRFDVDGNILNEFIHPGGIYDMEMYDIDQDGEYEILIGGTNNAFNSAAVAIMPSRTYSGTTPQWENTRQLDGGTVDSNLIYIKFPHWGEYDMTGTQARTHVNDIHLNSSEGFIVSVVLGGSTETGSYLYSFDWDLNLLGLSVSDGFLGKYHKLTGHHFFSDYEQDEWRTKMSEIEVWQKGEWSHPFTKD